MTGFVFEYPLVAGYVEEDGRAEVGSRGPVRRLWQVPR